MRAREARAKTVARMIKSRSWVIGTQPDIQEMFQAWVEAEALKVCGGDMASADLDQVEARFAALTADEFRQFVIAPVAEELVRRADEARRLRRLCELNGIEA